MTETVPKPFTFVLMPLDDSFRDVYQLAIRPACGAAGSYCERVDEQIFHESILQRIYNQIAKADIVVADMTGRNPNVFYEVGYAHALGKRVILLTQNGDDIPFDLKHYPHIIYGGKLTDLKADLEVRVRWCIDHPDREPEPEIDSFAVFINGQAVVAGVSIGLDMPSRPDMEFEKTVLELALDIHNESDRTLEIDRANLGVVVPAELRGTAESGQYDDARAIRLPDSRYLYMFEAIGTVPARGWRSQIAEIGFRKYGEAIALGKKRLKCELRTFTAHSTASVEFELFFRPRSQSRRARPNKALHVTATPRSTGRRT